MLKGQSVKKKNLKVGECAINLIFLVTILQIFLVTHNDNWEIDSKKWKQAKNNLKKKKSEVGTWTFTNKR